MNVYKLRIIKKYYIMTELMFLKELMIIIKQVHQKTSIFVTIGIFQIKGLNFDQMSVMSVMMYW